jgi:hypothetical protein
MKNGGDRLFVLVAIGLIAVLAVAMAPLQRPAAQGITMTVYVHLPVILKQPTSTATTTSTVYVAPTSTPTATTAPAPCQCYADLYNCDDFATQGQAQACYDYCWSLGYGDVHHLDADHDGIACEWLP